MTTGSKFAAFSMKMLIGFQDIGLRGFTALRASHIESTLARWDVDGVFNTKLVIAANGANGLQITGTSKCTDGLGHIMNIASAYKKDALFQNTNAIVYHVGLMYAEIPAGLRINPKTGLPQFDSYVEEVGFAAAPTSVTNNGNGTLTFNVNSVTEAAVSNAGRLVRVYKVVPANGATTFAMALEECTVTFGANNTITTVGNFGQTSVSTTAGDYIVVCMGPRVARNTDLSAVSGVCYLGTVTGNGGTPVTFSNTNQTLLKTFQDASQVVYTPAGWLSPGATNVQLALDALVNGLQASTPSGAAAGSARIGVYPPDWTPVASGGIGTVADGTFTTSATLTNLALAVDTAIRRRHAFLTKNDGVGAGADEATGTSLANQLGAGASQGRAWWLKTLANAGTTPYSIAATTTSPNMGNYLFGEFSDPSQASPHLRKTRVVTSGNIFLSGGKWQRIWLDPPAGANVAIGGAGAKSGLIFEDFGINGGNIGLEPQATAAAEDPGFFFRSGVIKPKDEATKGNAGTWLNGRSSGGTASFLWAVHQDLLIYGPSATQTSPAGASSAILVGSQLTGAINGATVAAQPRPLVYRDCVIVMQRTTDFAAITCTSQHKIVFENCHFFGLSGAPAGGLITLGSNAHLVMRDCVVFAPEGSAIDAVGSHCLFENVTMVCGIGGSSTITAPIAFQVSGDHYGATVNNCRVILGAVCFRSNATATTTPLIRLGTANAGFMNVRNLLVKVEGAAADLGWAKLVQVQNQAAGNLQGVFVDGLFVDCGGRPPVSTSSNSLVTMEGAANNRCNVEHFSITNIGIPVTTNFGLSLVECLDFVTGRCWTIQTPSAGAGAVAVRDHLRIANSCSLEDILFPRTAGERYTTAIFTINGNGNTVKNARSDGAMASTGTGPQASFIYALGNFNTISDFTNLPLSTTGPVPGIKVDGRDNCVCDGSAVCVTNTASFPIAFTNAATRRNRFVNMNVQYEGTTSGAIQMLSLDSLVDSATFYRSGGATAPVANVAAGSVTGSTITSTTL